MRPNGATKANPRLITAKLPERLGFASSGVGGIQHIAREAFKLQAGVDMLHEPFKGTGDSLAALISGEVDMTFSSSGSALPQANADARIES